MSGVGFWGIHLIYCSWRIKTSFVFRGCEIKHHLIWICWEVEMRRNLHSKMTNKLHLWFSGHLAINCGLKVQLRLTKYSFNCPAWVIIDFQCIWMDDNSLSLHRCCFSVRLGRSQRPGFARIQICGTFQFDKLNKEVGLEEVLGRVWLLKYLVV